MRHYSKCIRVSPSHISSPRIHGVIPETRLSSKAFGLSSTRASLAVQSSPRFHLGAACISNGMQACIHPTFGFGRWSTPPPTMIPLRVPAEPDAPQCQMISIKRSRAYPARTITLGSAPLSSPLREYHLPCLAHYDGALDMHSIVN